MKFQTINKKIQTLKDKQKQSFFEEKHNDERKATSKIKVDARYFFKYANRFRKTLTSPSILVDDNGNLVNNHKAISDLLQDQFKSVFSKHNDNLQPQYKTT